MNLTRRTVLAGGVVAGLTGGGLLLARIDREPDGADIPPETRRRLQRALRRTPRIVGSSLDERVSVERVPFRAAEAESRFQRIVDAAQHLDETDVPDVAPGPLATYNPGERTIEITDLDTIPQRVTVDQYLDVSLGEFRRSYPSEPLLAHELTHAIQFDTVGRHGGPQDFTRDAEDASLAIVEGTAQYVECAYQRRCADGEFEPCTLPAQATSLSEVPLWALSRRLIRYVNGAQFVQSVLADRGWEGVWDLHRNPPATSATVMFPARYPDGHGEPTGVEFADRSSSEWLVSERDRLGVNALYVKLLALDRADPRNAPSVTDGDPVTAVQYGPGGYRVAPLRDWISDSCIGYLHVDDPDRFGSVWVTEWASAEAAERITAIVKGGYEALGEREAGGWHLNGRYQTVAREETSVIFGMGPDRTAAELILGRGTP